MKSGLRKSLAWSILTEKKVIKDKPMPFKYQNGRIIEVKHKTVYGRLLEVSALSNIPVSDKDYKVMSKRRCQLIYKEFKSSLTEKEEYELDRLQYTFYKAFLEKHPECAYPNEIHD